jgi:hypothetical protein
MPLDVTNINVLQRGAAMHDGNMCCCHAYTHERMLHMHAQWHVVPIENM